MPGNKCSNCAAYNFECKYEEAAKVCRRSYRLPLATGPLTCHVRNEGPLKGAYIHRYGVYQNVPTFCIRYVESLESRLEKMESLLQRVRRL